LKRKSENLFLFITPEAVEPQNLLKTVAYARADLKMLERSKRSQFSLKLEQLKNYHKEEASGINELIRRAKEREEFIENYFLQNIQKAYDVDGRILEATTRAREICSEFNYYEEIEKYQEKLKIISSQTGIKAWIETIKVCKKI
jgi:hypothetical protein